MMLVWCEYFSRLSFCGRIWGGGVDGWGAVLGVCNQVVQGYSRPSTLNPKPKPLTVAVQARSKDSNFGSSEVLAQVV